MLTSKNFSSRPKINDCIKEHARSNTRQTLDLLDIDFFHNNNIIIIKYLYSANILKVQKRFTEVTLKILKTLFKKNKYKNS